jgi:Flp pilus assembly protein TadG
MRIPTALRRWRGRPRGQVIVIFALSSVVFVGMCAVVVDVAWYWSNNLRIQRAADAAALAGAVKLPADVAGAVTRAQAEATKNGYTAGGGVTITACSDANKPVGCTGGGGNDRQLNVTISAPVNTFFMRVFGINSITATRTGKAEFVLPVPMGSPENYYGVFGPLRKPETEVTTTKGTNAWTNPGNVFVSDSNRASSATDGQAQAWGFASDTTIHDPIPAGATIYGIEVWIEGRTATSSSNCKVEVSLSWDNGTTWTTGAGTGVKTVNLTSSEPGSPGTVVGGTTDTWGAHPWVKADFAANQFRIRVTNIRVSPCASTAQIDSISVRANYNLPDPYGAGIDPRGFWGTLINQGAEKINGDAYLPKWNPRTSSQNAEYSPADHYNYAFEVPSGLSNGELWIFDPVFCATNGNGGYGTGDRYFGGGNSATSAFYTLYDTKDTPYDLNDDTVVPGADSGGLFRASSGYSDQTLGGPTGLTDCSTGATSNPADGRYWHNRWWRIASGLPGGATYRLWTRSTDPSNPGAMDNANGHNSFAIWGTASGAGTPRVYGIGSIEMFTPLEAGQPATLYLAQIEAVHAGKTVEIKLWDPGDTNTLSASLEILQPTAAGYQPASFNYTAAQAASGAAACNDQANNGVTSLTTNTGGSSVFNGCWVTIQIPLSDTYDAPTPPGEPGPGWWKIRYTMGSGSSNAFDLTTWEVRILGNPVHLKIP